MKTRQIYFSHIFKHDTKDSIFKLDEPFVKI